MYVIVEVGGKQLSLKKGDVVEVEKQEAEAGATLVLDKVLMVRSDDKILIGAPYVAKAVVETTVELQTKGPKLVSFKYRRRKASHTKKGHRQKLTVLKVTDIKLA
jgi:large subunit ribosomal protein L21